MSKNPHLAPFIKKAGFSFAVVHRLAAWRDIPGAIIALRKEKKLKGGLKASPHPDFLTLEWRGIRTAFGPAEISDHLGLTRAIAGISETGTVAFASNAENPASLNFVPEVSIVALRECEILDRQEDFWALLARRGKFPRTVNLVTGPSRTGDIEQKLYLGAHGPKEVHIFLVKD